MVKTLALNHKFFYALNSDGTVTLVFVYMLVIAASYMAVSVFLPLRDVSYPELLHKRAIFVCVEHTRMTLKSIHWHKQVHENLK